MGAEISSREICQDLEVVNVPLLLRLSLFLVSHIVAIAASRAAYLNTHSFQVTLFATHTYVLCYCHQRSCVKYT